MTTPPTPIPEPSAEDLFREHTFKDGVCTYCECPERNKDLFACMTVEEAQKAYDEAPEYPISPEEIEAMVKRIIIEDHEADVDLLRLRLAHFRKRLFIKNTELHAALLDAERLRTANEHLAKERQTLIKACEQERKNRFDSADEWRTAVNQLEAKCAALERAGDELAIERTSRPWCMCNARGPCEQHRKLANWTAAKALAPGDTGGEGRTT